MLARGPIVAWVIDDTGVVLLSSHGVWKMDAPMEYQKVRRGWRGVRTLVSQDADQHCLWRQISRRWRFGCQRLPSPQEYQAGVPGDEAFVLRYFREAGDDRLQPGDD